MGDCVLDLERTVDAFIDRYGLLQRGAGSVIVGLSGGADSVALLGVLTALGYDCIAFHCNFHLRGSESDRDMNHARHIAEAVGAKWHVEHFDIPDWRRKHGGSVEMACRDSRYEAFERIRRQEKAQAIAVAHHREDNVETVLHNMMRGTGIAGLSGMEPERDHIVRPMLGVSRDDIERYLTGRGLCFVTDSTNLHNDYARNRIRNIVVPAMISANPDAISGIELTIERMRETERIYHLVLNRIIEECMTHDGIDLNRLARDENGSLALYEHLRESGVSRRMAGDMIASCCCSGRRFEASGRVWINDHGILRQSQCEDFGSGQFPFVVEHVGRSEFVIERGNRVAYFDGAVLDSGLSWKYWEQGDRMAPFGMRGNKKLSDLFRDAKIGVDRKERIPILTTRDGEILFVPGVRASRLYQVDDSSVDIVRIRLLSDVRY